MTNDDDRTRLDTRPWGGQQRVLPRAGFKPVASRVVATPAVTPGERARRISALPGLPPERPSLPPVRGTPSPARGTQPAPHVVRARGTKPPPIPLAALLPRASLAAMPSDVAMPTDEPGAKPIDPDQLLETGELAMGSQLMPQALPQFPVFPSAPQSALARYALPLTIAIVALVLVARYLIQS